jgi:hypothetical protein
MQAGLNAARRALGKGPRHSRLPTGGEPDPNCDRVRPALRSAATSVPTASVRSTVLPLSGNVPIAVQVGRAGDEE